MNKEIILAFVGILSGAIGLLTAIANRKQVIEQRHITVVETRNPNITTTTKEKKWYDNHFYVFLGVFFFYPIGAYALVQSRTINTFWKVTWFTIGFLWFLAVVATGGEKN